MRALMTLALFVGFVVVVAIVVLAAGHPQLAVLVMMIIAVSLVVSGMRRDR